LEYYVQLLNEDQMASFKPRKDKNGKTTGWYVQIRLRGHKPECSTHERLTDAKIWAKETESAIRFGRYFKTSEARKHTLAALVDKYIAEILPTKEKSIRKQKAQLLWWKSQIGHMVLADISQFVIAEQRDKLLKGITPRRAVRSNATVVRYMAAMGHAFKIAVREWGWIDNSPMEKVSKPKESRGRVRYLSDQEREALLHACMESSNKLLYPAVIISLSCGMRKSEILNLRWADVDFQKERVILHQTKNGERKSVPIKGLALQLFQALDKVRRIDTALVFPGKNPHKPMDIRAAWESAIKSSGLKIFVGTIYAILRQVI
jgi:integrase